MNVCGITLLLISIAPADVGGKTVLSNLGIVEHPLCELVGKEVWESVLFSIKQFHLDTPAFT